MATPKITESDLCRAAKRLRTSTAEVETVAEVESAGQAFYPDGFPVILFERHKFHKFTGGKYAKDHPRISSRTAGGYSPPKGAGTFAERNEKWQRSKFSEAFKLDPVAAMKSCSWGRFQLMGFNYEVCGFKSVGAFVDAMKESEGRQLDAFVEFVINSGLGDELRNHEWEEFARRYNGPGYKKNDYHIKLPAAYKKFSKRKIHCGEISAAAATKPTASLIKEGEPSVTSEQPPTETEIRQESGDTTITVSEKNEQDVNSPAKVSEPSPYMGVGFWGVIKRDLAAATGGNLSFSALAEYAQQASGWPEWVVGMISKLAVGLLIATFGYFVFRVVHYVIDTHKKNQRVKVEAEAATSTVRKDIEWQ